MIDWSTLIFPDLTIDLPVDKVVKFSPDGEIQFVTECGHSVKYDEGSFSENTNIRNIAHGLRVDGNPSKWLQGHNLFGCYSWELVDRWIYDISKRLGNISVYRSFERRQYHVTRVDLTESFMVDGAVDSYLDAILQFANSRNGSSRRGPKDGSTVYFQKNSRRSTVKFYNKLAEVLKHGFNPNRINTEQERFLLDFAKDVLRVEVCLRKKYLDDVYGKKIDWHTFDFYEAWKRRLDGITFPESVEIKMDDMSDLPGRYQIVYMAWRNGEDVKRTLSRTTFYRLRKKFLDQYGIDLATPAPSAAKCRVIPLFHPVAATPKPIPQEAYSLGLVA